MTSVRKRLELAGKLDELTLKFFLENEGHTPLCCFEVKDRCIRCDMIKEFLPVDEFRKKCLECQKISRERLKLEPIDN